MMGGAVEWLQTTAFVALVVSVSSMLACIVSAVYVAGTKTEPKVAGLIGRGTLLVAMIAACIVVGCAVLLLGIHTIALASVLAP